MTTGDGEPARPRMTMRVYRVSPDNPATITEELGRVDIMADQELSPLLSGRFPPCRCPLHRQSTNRGG